MPRGSRIVVPGLAHHVTQRGNRRQPIFFCDADRRAYRDLVALYCRRHRTRCLAWCLMDNHVHLILVPETADGLRATLAAAHTVYSQRVNAAQGLGGHLFQGRFASYPMADGHLYVAARYIENNPVKAGLVARAEDWPWSSARAHVTGAADGLTDIGGLGKHIANWRAMLARGLEAADEADEVERAGRSGYPLGPAEWRDALAAMLGRRLAPARRGRKPSAA
ncbi:MAG: transposase [Qipengyuania sp.]|jgi:putative transposase|nr:transposase [Qipengyuania sp.]